jgi:eukaryotic-like serine/threonine-protein kinase
MVGRSGPLSLQGQRAVVFFADTDQGPLAVRCLKTPVPAGAERYSALRHYLTQHPVPALIQADWVEDAIQVKGYPWPVITMERVVGPSLLTFARNNLDQPERLRQVAADWLALTTQLSAASVAHGDLQQDNVRVADGGQLRLIDLDAVWIPTLTHLAPPPERGHPNFQHPERTHGGYWGRYVDTFPALVIYISLRALAADPGLFEAFNNSENLIFSDEDFLRPGKTSLWPRLWSSPDLELRDLVSVLEHYCRTSVRMDVDLAQLLSTDSLPRTAPRWVSPGVDEVRDAWWASQPPEVAPARPVPPAVPAVPVAAGVPAAPETAPFAAGFTAANLSNDWWKPDAAADAPASAPWPKAPAVRPRRTAVTYAAVAAFIVLLVVILILVAG